MSASETVPVQHRVGVCPACRCGVWADLQVLSTLSAPVIDSDGRARVGASAEVVASEIHHSCHEINE